MVKPIPRVGRNGISLEYRLALGSVEHYLKQVERYKGDELGPRYIFMAARTLAQRPLLKYEEYFEPQEYEPAITEHNKNSVAQLNTVVDELNLLCMGEKAIQTLRSPASEESKRVTYLYHKAIGIIG